MAVTISGSGQIVKQVINATLTTSASTTSTSPVTTGLTATITPTNSANKIFVIINGGVVSANQTAVLNIARNGSTIGVGSGGTYNSNSIMFINAPGGGYPLSMTYLDSPATTSATTYSLFYSADTGTVAINKRTSDSYVAAISSITLMEIAYA